MRACDEAKLRRREGVIHITRTMPSNELTVYERTINKGMSRVRVRVRAKVRVRVTLSEVGFPSIVRRAIRRPRGSIRHSIQVETAAPMAQTLSRPTRAQLRKLAHPVVIPVLHPHESAEGGATT